MIWYMIWYDMIWYDMIWYDIWYVVPRVHTLSCNAVALKQQLSRYLARCLALGHIPLTACHQYLLCHYQKYCILSALTERLTPWSTVLLENLTHPQLVFKTLAFYGTQRFITAFTRTCHLFLSWTRSIQSTPHHHTSWRSILILSSCLCLGLPDGLFPSDLPTKTLYASLLSPISATCPTCLMLLDLITQTVCGDEYRSLNFSECDNILALKIINEKL